ncbi:MAG: hypothetical protein ACI9OJ_005307 [Myxococcota bacterium]|jgi:hypothetical protein
MALAQRVSDIAKATADAAVEATSAHSRDDHADRDSQGRFTKTRRCYQIHANDRHPERMRQLANAIAEINAHNINHGNRRLSRELLE